MTTSEAKVLLMMHSFRHPDIHHPKMETGFLGSLRPYCGLKVENFHEVMTALRVMAPSLQESRVDRDMVGALWSICDLSYSWGVHPGGMLRRNDLITPSDVERLERWSNCISYASRMLLGGDASDAAIVEAFHGCDCKETWLK